MQTIEEWQLSAIRMSRQEFAGAHPGFYLVKRPEILPPAEASSSADGGAIGFLTASAVALVGTGDPTDEGFAWQWRIAPVTKKLGNPFPERVSIGRAPNCDITIRLPFISKLHAHFVPQDDGTVDLIDQKSANGTTHNGRQLDLGERVNLTVTDRVLFGTLELEVADAGRLFDILLGEARR
ncbi:MAG: FHA domain-containing protein [Deltaproteobacteria bacterium]|nr:FHA domain-containing protein [Deltaproteobacteria bacterium]